jgi:DNA mismatch repair protein MutS
MQEYLAMKESAPGAVLLFRLGDFYEAFFGDAVQISKTLDLVLTHRGTDDRGVDIPMCGLPWHAADNYLGRLAKAGISVAIAEQMETPEQAKERGHKQIERKIVRVLTSGTITDENLLSPKKSNWLAAVKNGEIAAADISTGELLAGGVIEPFDELARLDPAEVLFDLADAEAADILRIRNAWPSTGLHARQFDGTALGMIRAYLKITQRDAETRLLPPKKLNGGAELIIDANTWRSLEIDSAQNPGGACLLDILDQTKTAAGGRKLRAWLRALSADPMVIGARQDHIEHLVKNPVVLRDFTGLLAKLPDVARSFSRLSANRGTPRDLLAVLGFLDILPEIKDWGAKLDSALAQEIQGLEPHDGLREQLRSALNPAPPAFFRDGGVIKTGYRPELDAQLDLSGGAKEAIAALQAEYSARAGFPVKIKFNGIIGYFIEVAETKAAAFLRPDSGFVHRQTTGGNIRFTTAELSRLDSEIKNAAGRAAAIEQGVIAEIVAVVLEAAPTMIEAAELLAEIDVYCGLANVAADWNWTRPKITKEPVFDVVGGRHPVVEAVLRERADSFVKNDCVLTPTQDSVGGIAANGIYPAPASGGRKSATQSIALLTGPNMSGKSTYLRQNAIIIALAHLGSFVPADAAVIGIADQLFSRVGASDNLASGQSTFMVEMSETANILNRMTPRSFIIFDEIGRGTATYDGMAIARAVLGFLDVERPRCLFATHYHELTDSGLPNVKNLTIKIAEDGNDIIFMHKIIDGVASKSYGIHVAKMAGMPSIVVKNAEHFLQQLEQPAAVSPGAVGPQEAPRDDNAMEVVSDNIGQLSLF